MDDKWVREQIDFAVYLAEALTESLERQHGAMRMMHTLLVQLQEIQSFLKEEHVRSAPLPLRT